MAAIAAAEDDDDELMQLALPPGALPVPAVRREVDRRRRGEISDEVLIACVDRHGEALEAEIARAAVRHLTAYYAAVDRLEVQHDWIALRLAQAHWLRRFPSSPSSVSAPLAVEMDGRTIPVPALVEALRGLELEERLLAEAGAARARVGRRGAAASMAALYDAGCSSSDVALELGTDAASAWRILNGRKRPPPGFEAALQKLVGHHKAELIIAGIPAPSSEGT